ncbi:MAG: LysM peptidoglycan-binding domain-containing protein [Actinomycetota bacterium]
MTETGVIDQRRADRAVLGIFKPNLSDSNVRKGDSIAEIKLQFNPKEYAVQAQASWESKASAQGVRPPQYKGSGPAKMTLEVFLDEPTRPGSGSDMPLLDQVDHLLACVQPAPGTLDDRPFPPVLEFVWGDRRFLAVASSVSAKFTMFSAEGVPIRAVCSVGLSVFSGTWPKQNPTSFTPRIDRSHRVTLGDSLASIAHRHYGDPTMWRAIAEANEIDDPARLELGAYLLVPSPGDAARMLR